MEQIGQVIEIFSAPKGVSGLPRPKAKELQLVKDYGILKDKFAGDDIEKSVMIIGQRSYDIAKENGINLEKGSYGENILFDFDPHMLNIGDIIQVGDALLEITQKCTLCSHLSIFHKHLPKIIKNHRGLYCKIVKSGKIIVGSSAYLVESLKSAS